MAEWLQSDAIIEFQDSNFDEVSFWQTYAMYSFDIKREIAHAKSNRGIPSKSTHKYKLSHKTRYYFIFSFEIINVLQFPLSN